MTSSVIFFIERWLGGLAGVCVSFSGILLCVLVAGAFWDRRIQVSELIASLLCGLSITFYQVTTGLISSVLRVSLFAGGVILTTTICIVFTSLYLRRRHAYGHNPNIVDEKSSIFSDVTGGRLIRGSKIGVPFVIFISALAVQVVGVAAPQVMIGDEVTHFYMLTHQAENLAEPNFYAEIPTATGEFETRRYPHSFFWHYIGAVIYSLTNESFLAVQFYQTFFFIQFLSVAYLLSRDRNGIESRSSLIYVLVLASLPLSLIFSVAFYQDVAMTAQILTAFYLLRRGRWLWASIFMSLAIGFKVTAALFFPSFFLLLFAWELTRRGSVKGLLATICALIIVLSATWQIGRMIVIYGDSYFYPQVQLEKIVKKTKEVIESTLPIVSQKTGISKINTELSARPQIHQKVKEHKPAVIANHPGDLRIPANFLIYGGLVLWLALLAGFTGAVSRGLTKQKGNNKQADLWLYFVGLTYTMIAAWYLRTAPDARFFLPAIPFLILPFIEKATALPKQKLMISLITAIALLQGGYVLNKAYQLRGITPEIQEGIEFLELHPPNGKIFMYPEGNYRFFPAQHEWYLGYHLKDFWKGDNNVRIKLLNKYRVSTIVIKKHLIDHIDENITNLGVYPVIFVNDIKVDRRFVRLFENDQLLMYQVPSF